MNSIKLFVIITFFIAFIKSSNIDTEAIKKLLQNDYKSVSVLLSTKTQSATDASQMKSNERENPIKESKIENDEIGNVKLKDLYEKIKLELPDIGISIDK